MSKLYTIKESTLKSITDSIRRKYNFDDNIRVKNIPLYNSYDSDSFWVTHFNDKGGDLEGTGVIYTKDFAEDPDKGIPQRGWHHYITFSPDEAGPNYYKISNMVDYGVSNYVIIELPENFDSLFSIIVAGGNGVAAETGTVVPLTCCIPTITTNARGIQEVVQTNTTYNITKVNQRVATGDLCVYSSVSTWANGNPGWSYVILARPTAQSNVFNVIKTIVYPLDTVREEKGADYTPANDAEAAEVYAPLLSSDWRSGDLIFSAHGGSTKYPGFFSIPSQMTPVVLDSLNLTPPENGFTYAINYGNDYPSYGIAKPNYTNPGATAMWSVVQSLNIGDSFLFENVNIKEKLVPTTTPHLLWYDTGYQCTARFDKIEPSTITIDGNLTDSAWGRSGWHLVNQYTGTFQAEPTDQFYKESQYMYKLRTDEDYLYLGLTRIFDNRTSSTQVTSSHAIRLWIRSNKDAALYTHFYDISTNSANFATTLRACYNGSLDANQAVDLSDAEIEKIEAKAALTMPTRVNFELKVPLEQFGGKNGFECFIQYCYAGAAGYTLYGQKIPKDSPITDEIETNSTYWLPYNHWHEDSAMKVDPADIEITADEALKLIEEAL